MAAKTITITTRAMMIPVPEPPFAFCRARSCSSPCFRPFSVACSRSFCRSCSSFRAFSAACSRAFDHPAAGPVPLSVLFLLPVPGLFDHPVKLNHPYKSPNFPLRLITIVVKFRFCFPDRSIFLMSWRNHPEIYILFCNPIRARQCIAGISIIT